MLRLDAAGRCSIDGVFETPTEMGREALRSALVAAAAETGAKEVVVVHAPETSFKHVISAFDAGLSIKELKPTWEKSDLNSP